MNIRIALFTAALAFLIGGNALAQTVSLSNSQFQAAVSTSSGGISSLKLKGDLYDTDYIWSGRVIGDVSVKYRLGTGAWQTAGTAASSDKRTIDSSAAPTRIKVNYTTNSSNSGGIKNFQLYETYEMKDGALVWTLRFKNNQSQNLEIGDLALPLYFNTNYEVDAPTLFEKRVLRHSFISGDGSYVFCGRCSGIGPYLVMTPQAGTHLEYFTDTSSTYYYTAYIHSLVKANSSGVGGNWRLPISSKILKPSGQAGDEVTYSFKFSWANDYDGVRQTIVNNGLIDVQIVPGMSLPQNSPGTFTLTTTQPINSITAEFPSNTTITYIGRKYGNQNIYQVTFTKLGENMLTVDYGIGRKLYLEFFCTQSIETLIKKRATFITTKQQWKNSKWYNGLFSLWDMKTSTLRSPDDPANLMAYCVGGSDDPSNCKAPYLAQKNLTFPVQSEIDAVEYHLQYFVWGGLQRKDTETPYPYGIYGINNWYDHRQSSTDYTLGRIYDYPAMVSMYYHMYKIAKLYGMTRYLTASQYLDRAFGTAKALFTVPIAVWGWPAYKLGLYHEPLIPQIIDDLRAEGRTADADYLKNEWEKKVKFFIYDDPYPYTSEYSMDSTAYECSEAVAKYALENEMQPDTNLWQDPGTGQWYSHPNISREATLDYQKRQLDANIMDRGWLEPNFYQYGSDIRGCGASMYIMTYMAQMGGWGILDYALNYSNDPAPYLRIGYGSYMSAWALINSGDAASNYGYWFPGVANDGATAWAFEPLQTGSMWCNSQMIGRWAWNYDGEIDHGFMGGISSAATILVNDPIFGLYTYGGSSSQNADVTAINPADGIRQKIYMMNLSPALRLELDRDRFSNVQVTQQADGSPSKLQIALECALPNAHTTNLKIEGMPAGDYLMIFNSIYRSISLSSGVNTVPLTVPAGLSFSVSIELSTKLTGTVKNASGSPIANAAVQVGGFGGPSAITGTDGTYTIHAPSIGSQVLYVDALGYTPKYTLLNVTGHGIISTNVTLTAASETGGITNGSFETAGGGGPATAVGWQFVNSPGTASTDYMGNTWPAINSNMYSEIRDTTQNQTPGGSACGSLVISNPNPAPGVTDIGAIAASGITSAVTSTTITSTGVNWTTNAWAGYDLVLQNGTVKKRYKIASNTATQITIVSGSITGDGMAAGCSYTICKLNFKNWYYGWISQTIPVDTESRYNFYFKGNLSSVTGAYWKFRWLDVSGNEISGFVDSRADGLWTASSGWNQYFMGMYYQNGWQRNVPMLQLAPPAGAASIEVAFGFTDETVASRAGTILIDDVVVDRIPPMTAVQLKNAAVNTPVVLGYKTVSLAPRNASDARTTNYFYVEDSSRSYGIKVLSDGSAARNDVRTGQKASINGIKRKDASTGEIYIELNDSVAPKSGSEVKPLMLVTRSVKIDRISVGQYVKTSGKVMSIAGDRTSFTISDGYATSSPIKVTAPAGPIASGQINVGDMVTVTGTVSKEGANEASAVNMVLLKSIENVIRH